MSTSVRTKAAKKQSPSEHPPALSPQLEHALMGLETACMRILDGRFTSDREDVEELCTQQRFQNIVTPISLALREHRGPRRFHYHYRHREDDDAILHPVMEPSPLETLSQVCKQALRHCQSDLGGIRDDKLLKNQRMLETALGNYLAAFKEAFTNVEK